MPPSLRISAAVSPRNWLRGTLVDELKFPSGPVRCSVSCTNPSAFDGETIHWPDIEFCALDDVKRGAVINVISPIIAAMPQSKNTFDPFMSCSSFIRQCRDRAIG